MTSVQADKEDYTTEIRTLKNELHTSRETHEAETAETKELHTQASAKVETILTERDEAIAQAKKWKARAEENKEQWIHWESVCEVNDWKAEKLERYNTKQMKEKRKFKVRPRYVLMRLGRCSDNGVWVGRG